MDVLTYRFVIEEGCDFLTQFLPLAFSVRRTLQIDSSARNGAFPWLLRVPHKPPVNTLLKTLYMNTVRFCRSSLWDGLRSTIRYKIFVRTVEFSSVCWKQTLFPSEVIHMEIQVLFYFKYVATVKKYFTSNVSFYCP
jgi:hypothetical protein